MKAMVIGLNPEYNYPGDFDVWAANNTRYASNFGASLICRSIMKQFDADYVDDFRDIAALRNKYDVCFLALATHVTSKRDVSYYADIVEKLDMKTVALSLGVQDFAQATSDVFVLHPSIRRLLQLVSAASTSIGVRGHYTAAILSKNGFKNVVPIGCPTLFWGLRADLRIDKPATMANPLVVYHQSLSSIGPAMIERYPVLGQDYEDEVFFTSTLADDHRLRHIIGLRYAEFPESERSLQLLRTRGAFPDSFDDWFNRIGRHDFVFGPRLHGCIAALIQGVPAVLTPRDLRIRELAEFFDIPMTALADLANKRAEDIFSQASYEAFNRTYPIRYSNYLHFLRDNRLEHRLSLAGMLPSVHRTAYDIRTRQALQEQAGNSDGPPRESCTAP